MKWNENDLGGGQIEPGGTYSARVVEAEERISQAGNPYLNLKLDVNGITLYDNVMPKWPQKLAHFCKSARLEDKWELQTLEASDCVGRPVTVVLSKEKYDKNGNVSEDGYLRIDDYAWDGREEKTGAPARKRAELQGVPAGQSARAKTALPADDIPF